MSDIVPTVLALYKNVIGARLFSGLKGEAGCLLHANRRSGANLQHQLEDFCRFFYSQRFAYW
jgi:hypothetical protein